MSRETTGPVHQEIHLAMDVIELIRSIVGPDLAPTQGQTAPVTPGEQLAGRVMARQPDGLFLVDFGKFQATAQIQIPVQVGDTIAVEARGTGAPMTFKIIAPQPAGRQAPVMTAFLSMPDAARDLGAPMGRIIEGGAGALSPPMRSALNRIQAHLAPLDPGTDVLAELGQQVRSSVENSGLFFEKKLEAIISGLIKAAPAITDQAMAGDKQVQRLVDTDLKPALLGLISAAADEPEARTGPLKALVQTAARILAQIQGNQQAMAENSRGAGTGAPLTYAGPAQTRDAPQGRLARALALVATLPRSTALSEDTEPSIKQALDRLMEAGRQIPRRPAGPEASRQVLSQRLHPLVSDLVQALEQDRSASDQRLEAVKHTAQRLLPLMAEGGGNPTTTPAEPYQIITFPLLLTHSQQTAGLKVFYRKPRGKGGNDDFRLSLLLNMEGLGGIRTDFHQVQGRLSLSFFTERGQTRDLIQKHTAQLQLALEGRFDDLAITVTQSQRKVAQFEKQSPAETFGTGLDLRV